MELDVGPRIIIRFSNGVFITETVCWAVIVAICMIIVAIIASRNLKQYPKGLQVISETIVEFVYSFVKNNMGKHNVSFAPFIGTLFLFLLFCNALGMIGQRAPSADVNFTFALGILVFVLIQYNGIRSKGIKRYLTHYAEPFPFMVPINIIEEIVFPVSLSFRLFGNILAGVIIVELFMHLMGVISQNLHLPIPLFQAITPLPVNAFFDIFEPFLQAFVFSMLTMVFIAKAIVVHGKAE
jgi:F0F1-type ATP synthase, subunit a